MYWILSKMLMWQSLTSVKHEFTLYPYQIQTLLKKKVEDIDELWIDFLFKWLSYKVYKDT